MIDSIETLTMKIDKKYYEPKLIEALSLYDTLVSEKIIVPRENQLNTSGVMPKIIHFNSKN